MLVLALVWLVLTGVLSAALGLVCTTQSLARRVRRAPPQPLGLPAPTQ